MCDVHLVETARKTGPVPSGTACCYFGASIEGDGVIVEGQLEDGSPGLYRFIYHDDCAWDMEHDDDQIDAHDDCFNHGVPVSVELGPPTAAEGLRPPVLDQPSAHSRPSGDRHHVKGDR